MTDSLKVEKRLSKLIKKNKKNCEQFHDNEF